MRYPAPGSVAHVRAGGVPGIGPEKNQHQGTAVGVSGKGTEADPCVCIMDSDECIGRERSHIREKCICVYIHNLWTQIIVR